MPTPARPRSSTSLLRRLDALLRGRLPRAGDPSARDSAGDPPAGARELTLAVLALGASYGLCMATYGLVRADGYGLLHLLAVALKVPALFLLTLAVTFPSLYVFSALAGSELDAPRTSRLLLAATAVMSVVLASFGPVTLFFTFSTKSHPFMQLLSALLFAIAGAVGLRALWKGLVAAFPVREPAEPASEPEPGSHPTRAGRARAQQPVKHLVLAWLLIYAVVGAQMGWILRPFIGAPDVEAALFRPTESNVFEGLLEALRYL